MARHGLAGTSPTARSATPTPPHRQNSGTGPPRRNSIVPFIRPGSGSSAQSEDAGPGSFKAGEDTVIRLGQSLQQRRRSSVSSEWEGRSVDDSVSSSLKRPERRSSLQSFARGNVPVSRQEGFLTQGAACDDEVSPRPPVAPTGLLSRQFSSGALQPKRESKEELKVGAQLP